MTIKEVSEKYGLTQDTLRYYERVGVIPAVTRTSGGIRDYQEEDARPALVSLPENLDQYDEIYLGYPNYCGTMPMAVYTFLESFDFTGKKIHPFCTHEGSGLSGTEQDIRNAAKGAVVGKGLAIHESSVDAAKPALQKWIQE